MARFLLILLIALNVFAENSFEWMSSEIVAKAVNAITGEHVIEEEDIVIQGAFPLRLSRFYNSGKMKERYIGWQSFQHLFAPYANNIIELTEPNGTILNFHRKYQMENKKFLFRLSNLEDKERITNVGRGKISGKSNLKNVRIEMANDDAYFTAYCSDGSVRHYQKAHNWDEKAYGSTFRNKKVYLLRWEKLTNQSKIYYDYDSKNRLEKIRTTNHNDSKTYATAKIRYHSDSLKENDYDLITSVGHELLFEFENHKYRNRYLLKKASTPFYPNERIEYFERTNDKRRGESDYDEDEYGYLLKYRTISSNRFYELDYYWRTNNIDGEQLDLRFNDKRLYRVKTISSPVGVDKVPHITHRFSYFPDENYTLVRDCENNLTKYQYSKEKRLEKIFHYGKDDVLAYAEKFIWGKGVLSTNLLCHILLDENKKPLLARRFFYDNAGNVLTEKLYGDLSGKGKSRLVLKPSGFPDESKTEIYTIKREYSNDGLNLLLRQEEPRGKVTINKYIPKTSLLSSQIICEKDEIKIRHFYEYNEDYILVKEIIDDGHNYDRNNLKGVKTRRIKEIIPKANKPFLDMPHIILEKYWNGEKEVLLKKTVLSYTPEGKISKEDIYDAEDHFCFSKTYEYDKAGRLISETNALGQQAEYKYDPVGNKILCKDFSGQRETHFIYDFSNRLTCTEEMGNYGTHRVTKHRYNKKHQKIETIDPNGHSIKYDYDIFGRVIKTHFPEFYNHKGAVHPVRYHNYDSAGRETSTSESKDRTVYKTYNSRHQVTSITHPDGTEEKFVYNLNGTLQSHINQNGDETFYTYDFLGRTTSITNALRQVTLYIYDSFNLISVIDAEGNTTNYEYDGLGRKISEEINGEKIEYFYDTFNRLSCTKKGDLFTFLEYNLLDQIIEERQEDRHGNLLSQVKYEYDFAGNKSQIKRYIQNNEAKETYLYDSFNRLIQHTDPLEHVTSTTYNDHYKNEFGQEVLQKIEIDPLGLQTITTYDPLNRIASIEKKNSKGQSLSIEENFFDVFGNLVKQVKNKNHILKREYDSMNRLICLIEEGSKKTTFTYTKTGLVKEKTKHDGVVLKYKYDDLGQLEELKSSDDTIHYIFHYNKIGQQICVEDKINKTISIRDYDHAGRLLEETLANGLTVSSKYDSQGRKRKFYLPDKSSVDYVYDPLYLREISYHGFVHRYNLYDLSGHSIEQELGHLGIVSFGYDLRGRKKEYHSPFIFQKVDYDPVGNIERLHTGQETENYDYDQLYQLTKEKGYNYIYNPDGNRLTKNNEEYSYNKFHQVTHPFHYDENGNPKMDDDKIYEYDALDRLIKIKSKTNQTPSTYFSYDYKGRLLSRKIQNVEVLFFYDDQKEIGMADSKGKILQLRILNPTFTSERGASVLLELSGKKYLPIHDLFGNIKSIVDLQGTVVEEYQYSAFGEGIKEQLNPWQYASKRTFAESGLIYFGQRFYHPNFGRWLTPDPAGFVDGYNLYSFVGNNPLSKFDAFGLLAIAEDSPSDSYESQPSGVIVALPSESNPADDPEVCTTLTVNPQESIINEEPLPPPPIENPPSFLDNLLHLPGFLLSQGLHDVCNRLSGPSRELGNLFSQVSGDQTYTTNAANSLNNIRSSIDSIFSTHFKDCDPLIKFRIGEIPLLGGGTKVTGRQSISRSEIPKPPRVQLAEDTEILFGQESVSSKFKKRSPFGAAEISDVVEGLKNGTVSPDQLPIQIIVRDGKTITLNNRSYLTLKRSGLRPTIVEDCTGIEFFEELLNDHLLGRQPSETIRVRGGPEGTSLLKR